MTRVLSILTRRLVQGILVGFVVVTLSFLMMRSLPGDMAYRIAPAATVSTG